jgi:hypothetical protein
MRFPAISWVPRYALFETDGCVSLGETRMLNEKMSQMAGISRQENNLAQSVGIWLRCRMPYYDVMAIMCSLNFYDSRHFVNHQPHFSLESRLVHPYARVGNILPPISSQGHLAIMLQKRR